VDIISKNTSSFEKETPFAEAALMEIPHQVVFLPVLVGAFLNQYFQSLVIFGMQVKSIFYNCIIKHRQLAAGYLFCECWFNFTYLLYHIDTRADIEFLEMKITLLFHFLVQYVTMSLSKS